MTEIESETDLFKNYHPKELKKCELEDSRFFQLPAWSGERYKLANAELYSQEILHELGRRFEAAVKYLTGMPLNQVAKEYKLEMSSIKRFAKDLLIGKTMKEILKNQFGNMGKFGLDLAIAELRIFEKINNRKPHCDEKGFRGIPQALYKGNWNEFGIRSWDDLLVKAFTKIQISIWQEQELNKWIGPDGFQHAISELQDFYEKENRKPFSKDFIDILHVIQHGHWRDFGISKWNDLLEYVFGEVNVDPEKYSKKCSGETGLLKIQMKLKEFKNRVGRLPVSGDREMASLTMAVLNGYWVEQGIKTWNDLLKATFGEVNIEPNKYTGIEGLRRVVKILKDFERKNKRRPVNVDKVVGGILCAIQRGEWSAFGIKTWNDLLLYTFGEINHNVKKYKGTRGFERAIKKLNEFKEINKRIPNNMDKGMGGIVHAACRGEWLAFGIKTWNDLLKYVFNQVNSDYNKYTGAEGFERAITELKDFNRKNKRLPLQNDNGVIASACCRGQFAEFGIKTWNDLLKASFGKLNKEINKYVGQKGLERAANDLKEFKENNKRLPKTNDKGMGGIIHAIRRNEWSGFGIRIWNDLLRFTFNEVNKKGGKKPKFNPNLYFPRQDA